MTKRDTGLSELQESLLIMNAIGKVVRITLQNYPTTTAGQNEDLKFLLNNTIVLQICNFLDEFAFLERQLKNAGKEQVLRVLAPLYEPIKQNSRIRELRNRNVAHHHRDKKRRPSYACQTIVEEKLPQHHAEILFLGYCVVHFVERLRKYLKQEVSDAENKYLSYINQFDEEILRQAEKEIKSMREVRERLQALLNEVEEKAFKETPLTDALRQNIINLLEEEGLNEEQINHLPLIRRSFKNPRGLNEIIFEIAGLVVHTDNWDKNIHSHMHIGKLRDYSAKRKVRQMWGTLLHQRAFLYLKERLKSSGWKLKYGQVIDGKEYDCLGWKGKIKDAQHPDLAIEMHFPLPKSGASYELPLVMEQTRKMRERLKRIDAKYKYILIGVPQNKVITTLEISPRAIVHPDMKVVYQRYKFGKIVLTKQRVLSHK
jgi:hypothetical protein